MLAMKPGEDPYEFSRRRDLWLQSQVLKIAQKAMEDEYNYVADAQAPQC